MSVDLFISYAWTSREHREWVRLLASQLHLVGYDVKIDEKVHYGSSLSGFMREVTNAKHVLLILDENYIHRADTEPDSGVGIETKWISGVFEDRPANWLSVVFVRNPGRQLPGWLTGHKPKGFDFNANHDDGEFPGAAQINAIWRWIEGLPTNNANAVTLAELRRRAARIERVDAQRDPGNYASPALSGRVTFRYRDHRHYTIGHGEYEFKVQFSGHSPESITVYIDSGLKAIGLITARDYDLKSVENYLTPGRTVHPTVGQHVVLMNSHGALSVIAIDEVQREVNADQYVPEHVAFYYEILMP
jgi:hypothetical protein